MNRLWTAGLVLIVALAATSCTKKSNDPSSTAPPKFEAAMLQTNEFPAIDNADRAGSGIARVTFNVTRDSSNNITAATADAVVTLQNFPVGTVLTGAHIHPGRAGTSGGVVIGFLAAGDGVVLTNGSGGFTKTNIPITPVDLAQQIINDPAAYYFNVHTTVSTGGAVRGQLVKQ